MAFVFEKVDDIAWSSELQTAPYASPFHEYAWNDMVAEHFDYEFQGYAASYGDQTWLIPAYHHDQLIRSSFMGYGGPLALHQVTDGAAEIRTSVDMLMELKAKLGATSVQGTLYPADFWPVKSPEQAIEMTQTTILDITFTSEDIFNTILSGNCRTAIRKAAKSGVRIRSLTETDAYEQAKALLNETQRQVGSSYITDISLLCSIGSLNDSTIMADTYTAEINGQPIAMSTVVMNQHEAFHLFSGWDRKNANVCANQALHWNNILQAQKYGSAQYNMGESHTQQLLAAKLRWGGRVVAVPKLSS